MISPGADSSAAAGPDRQVFQINREGKQGLKRALANLDWSRHKTISPFLTWLALSTHADREVVASMIQERRKFLEKQMKREKETLKSFAGEVGEMIVPAILIVELTIQQFELELVWLQRAENACLGSDPRQASDSVLLAS